MPVEIATLWKSESLLRFAAVVAVTVLISGVVRRVAYGVLHRLSRGHPLAAGVLAQASTPMEWLVPLLLLGIALRLTPDMDSLHWLPALIHLLLIALLAVTTWLLVRCLGAIEQLTLRLHPTDMEDNLRARRVQTQVRVLSRTGMVITVILGLAFILMTIPGVRQFGASLLASAGLAGLAIGLAAKPVLSNLIAGLQIALTQPIRLDDVVIVENEWGRIEEITSTYVVVRIWDDRRLVVPLNFFIENPFQNWTRNTARLIGTVFLWVDYHLPLQPLRIELQRLCESAPEWDGRVCLLQVTEGGEHSMQLRALVSSADSGRSWDLRCRIREGLIDFIQREYPQCLPVWRARQLNEPAQPSAPVAPAEPE